jgi:hypothetical protein
VIRPTFAGAKVNETQLRAYEAALGRSRYMSVRVELLDHDERVQAELASGPLGVTGGQVDIDTTSDGPTRTLSLSILDPDRKLNLDPTPTDYGIFAGSFVRVSRGDWVDALGDYVWCPVFCGVVSSFTRDHPEVQITGIGKEALGLDPYVTLSTITIPRGTKVTEAIHRVMAGTGERRYRFPAIHTRIGHGKSVPRLSQPWRVAQKLAGTADRQLYYDGRGLLVMRRRPLHPAYTYLPGERSVLLTAPALTYDFTTFRNTVDVTGGVPAHHKGKLHVMTTVAKGNPLSPGALARNGVPIYAVVVVDDEQILRRARAEQIGRSNLAGALTVATDPSGSTFDGLPIPHLEEGDIVRVHTEDGYITLRMRVWTIPLTADSMPVGIKRVARWRVRYRHTRRGRKHA